MRASLLPYKERDIRIHSNDIRNSFNKVDIQNNFVLDNDVTYIERRIRYSLYL